MQESPLWDRLPEAAAIADCVVAACLAETGFSPPPGAELSLLLCDDVAIRVLNARWRGQDKATNVLSFSAPAFAGALGDIAIAFETVEDEARAQNKTLADHLAHMVAHGVLHLIGYDHEVEREAETMEALERRALARAGVADPYRDADADGEPDAP